MANPTTNYGWPMPTSTDLVTDLPADFALFGQPVDTSLKALNPETTLGDIAYRSSTSNTNTRLGIGSTGQVLTVASGLPSWATPAGGGSAMVLVKARTSFSGVTDTSTTFDGVFTSTYKNYIVIIDYINGSVGGGGSTLNMVYRYGGVSQTSYAGNTNQVGFSGTVTNIQGGANAAIGLGQIYSGDQSLFNITMGGMGVASSYGQLTHIGVCSALSASLNGGWLGSNARTYDGFQLSASSGNITGSATVYGLVVS